MNAPRPKSSGFAGATGHPNGGGRALLTIIGFLSALFLAVSPAAAAATGGTISSAGPLTQITTTSDLTCEVHHSGDQASEFFGGNSCGTFLQTDGTLFTPSKFASWERAREWTAESQSSSGSGTDRDPYRVITAVTGGDITLVQTDTYVTGSESYGTRITLTNTATSTRAFTLYRAADCYLQDSDYGFGQLDLASGAVACTTGDAAGSRVEQWAPLTPGSRAMEGSYGAVYQTIRSQYPFPNSCACQDRLDNGAGLSWSDTIGPGATRTFSHLTAFSPTGTTQVQDTDGDGFPDSWETPTGGVDTDGDTVPDLKLSDFGATPDKPDVFVQVDYTQTRTCTLRYFCSDSTWRPSLEALADVQRAFARNGVRLHIDDGPDSLMNPDTGAKWGSKARGGVAVTADPKIRGCGPCSGDDASFDWSQAFDPIRESRIGNTPRARLFHYALYVGTFNDDGNSGLSRSNQGSYFAGRDFMVAHSAIANGNPTLTQEAGTFMHELGHNLGLTHGGSVAEGHEKYKPNYPSVMNYQWQLTGVAKYSNNALLDYSNGTLEPVDERSLSEAEGLGPDNIANDIATKWACPGDERPKRQKLPVPSIRDVDWNCNGRVDGGRAALNVSGSKTDLAVLHDNDDWAGLTFDGGGALGGAGDGQDVPDTTVSEEASTDEQLDAAGVIESVSVATPGQISIQAGTQAPLVITLTSRAPNARAYSFNVRSDGASLSGLPSSVTLAPGATLRVTGTLSAGNVVRTDAYVELVARSATAGDADAGITSLVVTGQRVPDQPTAGPTPTPTPTATPTPTPTPTPKGAAPGPVLPTPAQNAQSDNGVLPTPSLGAPLKPAPPKTGLFIDGDKLVFRATSLSTKGPKICPSKVTVVVSAGKKSKKFRLSARREGSFCSVNTSVSLKGQLARAQQLNVRISGAGLKTVTRHAKRS